MVWLESDTLKVTKQWAGGIRGLAPKGQPVVDRFGGRQRINPSRANGRPEAFSLLQVGVQPNN